MQVPRQEVRLPTTWAARGGVAEEPSRYCQNTGEVLRHRTRGCSGGETLRRGGVFRGAPSKDSLVDGAATA